MVSWTATIDVIMPRPEPHLINSNGQRKLNGHRMAARIFVHDQPSKDAETHDALMRLPMATAVQTPATISTLSDPHIKEKLQELRQTDNYTNIYYLVRTYVYLAIVLGAT